MTYTFNMHEAKSKLSKLVELVLAGENVQIARDGEPVVELVLAKKSTRPLLGEFEPVQPILPPGFDPSKPLEQWEQGMLRKDALLIELMREIASEQSTS